MAKLSARRSRAPAAVSARKPRGRPRALKSLSKKSSHRTKTTTSSKSPTKDSTTKAGVTAAKLVKGGVLKKRGKRHQSVAAKAKKLKNAAKARRDSKNVANIDVEAEDDEQKISECPKPIKFYNDELRTSGLEWEVEGILDSKTEKKGGKVIWHYLVKWVGFPKSASTWEPESHLRNAQDLIAEFDDANPDKS